MRGKRFAYWFLGFVAVPYVHVFILTFICLFFQGEKRPFFVFWLCNCYSLFAAKLGFIAFAISLLGGRSWFLAASYSVPLLFIGGFWGTIVWLRYLDGLDRLYPTQIRDIGLVAELLEWLSFVVKASVVLAIVPAFIVGTITCLCYLLWCKKLNR